MRLTDEALKEFEILWRQDHPNEQLTKEQLLEVATRVMRAVELVYQPIPKEKTERLNELDEADGKVS